MSKIVKGSILDVAGSDDVAIALMNAKIGAICDFSGSMAEWVSSRNASRAQVQSGVLEDIQGRFPGQVAVLGFADYCEPFLDGNLPEPQGITNMEEALKAAKFIAEMGIRPILMSDGEPSDEPRDLLEFAAEELVGLMDVIYIGDENGEGLDFMEDLAAIVKGQLGTYTYSEDPKVLEGQLEKILLLTAAK